MKIATFRVHVVHPGDVLELDDDEQIMTGRLNPETQAWVVSIVKIVPQPGPERYEDIPFLHSNPEWLDTIQGTTQRKG